MHRSRVTALAIDVPDADHAREADFWSAALGVTPAGDDGTYIDIGRGLPGFGDVELFVQRVGDDGPRLHLDIETDDVEAEVARLEGLGASRVEQVRTWWIMRDPAGLVFCVVPPQTDGFPGDAATWD